MRRIALGMIAGVLVVALLFHLSRRTDSSIEPELGATPAVGRGAERLDPVPRPESTTGAPHEEALASDESPSSKAAPFHGHRVPPRGLPELSGIVVHQNGEPAAHSTVVLGALAVGTDSHGLFRFQELSLHVGDDLLAYHTGFLPVRIEDFGAWYPSREGQALRLILGPPLLTISGVVLNETGVPLSGARVWVQEETVLEDAGRFLEQNSLESLVKPRVPMALMVRRRGSGVETDEGGRFTVTGLLDREYTLTAWSRTPSLLTAHGPVPAGTEDVVLRPDPEFRRPELSLALVGRNGTPIANARVEAMFVTSPGSQVGLSSVQTDDVGRCQLLDAPRRGLCLLVRQPRVDPAEIRLPEVPDDDLLEVTVDRYAPCRIQLPAGVPLPVTVVAGDCDEDPRSRAFEGHREFHLVTSPEAVLWIHEGIETLQLYPDSQDSDWVGSESPGRELELLGEARVQLDPDETNVVRFD